jgi:hypothetical protein
MKEFINKKGIVFFLNLITAILAILGLIFYVLSAKDKSSMTETDISALVIVPFAISIALTAATLFLKHNLINIFSFILYFATFAAWLINQAGYLVNVFMGLDGNSFSFLYILTFVLIIACLVISIISFITNSKEAKK